jgi:uncharacterized protein YceK
MGAAEIQISSLAFPARSATRLGREGDSSEELDASPKRSGLVNGLPSSLIGMAIALGSSVTNGERWGGPRVNIAAQSGGDVRIGKLKVLMRAGRLLIPITLALGLSGCGTIFNFGAGTCAYREYPLVYGGVDIDVEMIASADFPLGLLIALVDFPFSLAADTVTLPYTIYTTVRGSRRPEEKAAPGHSSRGD